MTQIATIEKILDANHAEISVARQSACGHNCADCAGCGVTNQAVYARAENPIHAQPGQQVVVESSTKNMLGIVLLVYMVPFALFFLGYFTVSYLATVSLGYSAAVIGFAVGLVPARMYDRKLRRQGGLHFTIVKVF
jgi:sigma-E factor negative regulatory protein RseC